tara:strand:- start:6192 stop:8195 length:2004 start_codon:yes stop_codon:yes gene_type:complete
MIRLSHITLVAALVFLTVTPAHAQSDVATSTERTATTTKPALRNGAFGCGAAQYSPVGAQGPKGTYVPAFDDAVFDQQKILTYKECVLDGIASASRETLISVMIKNVVDFVNSGTDGTSAYVQNIPQRELEIADPIVEEYLLTATENIPEAYRRDIQTILARNYAQRTRTPQNALVCDVDPAKLEAMRNGDFISAGGWESFTRINDNLACTPLGSYAIAQNQLQNRIQTALRNDEIQLNRNNGFRSIVRQESIDIGGGNIVTRDVVITPGYIISELLKQVIGSGIRQAENADEFDEIISSTMANIGTRMLTDLNGLAGLSQNINGEPSYLSQLVTDSARRARGKIIGAATAIIENAIYTEREFVTARRDGVGTLSKAEVQLETWELACWDGMADEAQKFVVEKVKQRVCPNSTGTSTIPCNAPIETTKKYDSNVIVLRSVYPSSIIVRGYVENVNASVSVTASANASSTDPVTASLQGTTWRTQPIALTNLPDGEITVTAIEKGNSDGQTRTMEETLQKSTDSTGVVTLNIPTTLPNITVTASSQYVRFSETIAADTTRSRTIIDARITPLLFNAQAQVLAGEAALIALLELRDRINEATTADGQKKALERLDVLIANGQIHTDADVRNIQDTNRETEGSMQQLLEDTRTSWETGWCLPGNWVDYAL